MLDWYVVLTPLALLPIELLILFLGCEAALGTFTLAPPPLLKFNMDVDLQKTTAADPRQVRQITGYWSLWSLGSVKGTVPVPSWKIVSTDPVYDFIDPGRDPGAETSVPPSSLSGLDQVSCTCELAIGVGSDDSLDERVKIESMLVVFDPKLSTYVFTLTPKPPKPGAKREFVLREYSL
jgi:hypothetical protein